MSPLRNLDAHEPACMCQSCLVADALAYPDPEPILEFDYDFDVEATMGDEERDDRKGDVS